MKKEKKRWRSIIVLAMAMLVVFGLCGPAWAFSGSGSGTEAGAYVITTVEQLQEMQNELDACYVLGNDIDASDTQNWNGGAGFEPVGTDTNPFTGTFDGQGHTITGLYINRPSEHFVGLFGGICDGAEVENVILIDVNITGCGSVGALAGGSLSSTISCAWSSGVVIGTSPDQHYVGGLIGFSYGANSLVYKCCSSANVHAISDFYPANRAGGLAGGNGQGSIMIDCYATGDVSGKSKIGGLVSDNTYGSYGGYIKRCYSIGKVTGSGGGLVGFNWRDGITYDSYWDIQTSGKSSSYGGTGKTTAEMQTMSTFTDAGWDFVGETLNGIEDIWFIPQGDYPHLWWEGMQVPMKLTPRTLNCRSYGNWVKAHLTLPEGFTFADVDPDRPAVLHSFGFESAPLYVFVNESELVEIEAAFEREAVCSLAGGWPEALTVAGFLADGNIFLGTSTVRMIAPGMKEIEELSLYWLNADCDQPDWCDGIDLNRNSMVNLLDYALLLNSQVEFIRE